MAFVPHHAIVQAPDAAPRATVLMLHGILGSGRNLRSFANLLARAAPACRFVLVDLRNHGDSQGAPPPHDLDACVADLRALAGALGATPDAIVGHSFGGKVALTAVRERLEGLRHVWVLDATPDARDPADRTSASVEDVVAALRELPQPVQRREDVAEGLRARGYGELLANWMTTNLRSDPAGGYVWRFDLDAVEAMLDSYFATDLWSVLESPPPGVQLDVVRAARETRWTPAVLDRFARLDPAQVRLHAIDAGHWLHVEQPQALADLIAPSLQALT